MLPGAAVRLAPLVRRLSTAELGELGERLVARSRARAGWSVRGRRVRTPAGEVDLVLERDGELVIAEVKTRRGPLDAAAPLEVRRRQAARVRAAARWLARRGGAGTPVRVEWVEVRVDPRGAGWRARPIDPEDERG